MAGGEAWLIFCAWRYGGEDPWRLFNKLDSGYRRLSNVELPALRPHFPDRLRAFMYACGKVAAILDGKVKDTRPSVPRPRRPPADKQVLLPPGIPDPRED